MQHHATQAIVALNRGGKDAYQSAVYLRAKAESPDQLEALKQLAIDQTRFSNLLTGVCFAKSWTEVWSRNSCPRIENSQKAINWFTAVVARFAEMLRGHVEMRTDFVRKILLGNHQDAQTVLLNHQKMYGPSLWSLSWFILLAEESGGSHTRTALVDRFNANEFGTIVPIFARLFSLNADKTLPEEHVRIQLRNCMPTDDPPFKDFLELILTEDPSNEWKAWEILEHAEVLPLVDRYELFMRLTAVALASKHEDAAKLERAVVRIANMCDDRYLQYIADFADEKSHAKPCNETESLLHAWDAYLVSDYEKCRGIVEVVAEQRPELVSAHELSVKCLMYLGNNDPLSGASPIPQLRHHLRNVFSKNEHAEDSLNYLLRFASRFRIFPITAPLRALHAQHSTPYPQEKWHQRGAFAMVAHGPRNFEYGFPPATNQKYLARCATTFPDSVSIRFFHALSQGAASRFLIGCDAIPHIRHQFFNGLAATRRGAFDQALGSLTEFLALQEADKSNPLSPFAIEEARRVLIDVYRHTGDVTKMLRTVVEAFLGRPQSVRRLPLRRVFDSCSEKQEDASRCIEYPIIAYLTCDEPHEVCLELKRFIRAHGAEKPSDLIDSHIFDVRTQAILFLRVCSPEVIDSLHKLDSVEKVEAERLRLLNWVSKNAPAYARLAETEVLRLTQHAQLREALQKIEGARVVLNLPALREAEEARFSDAFFRYAAQRELATQTQDELLTAIHAARHGSGLVFISTKAVLDKKEASLHAFVSAFRQIRDAFVSSPHFGIDACLSGRIRHGILVQHIRKPFVERRLAVKGDSSEKKEISAYWRARLPCGYDANKMEAVMKILFAMTEEIDSIAQEVKNVWIQSKTETRNHEGLFDYAFSEEQLLEVRRRIADATSVEAFLDGVFDMLLERTRKSLGVVRDKIETNLLARLPKAIDDATLKLALIASDYDVLPLRRDLVLCRQETEPICHQMTRWFQESDASLMGDADFDLVARTAVGMVERLNPDFRGRHLVEVDSQFRIRGRHFTAVVHMLFFLLENAIRHSGLTKEAFNSKVKVRAESNQLVMGVENQTASPDAASRAAQTIREVVADLLVSLDPETVVKEGGSGFAKIIAAVRYEFKQSDPIIKADYDGALLRVSVTCDIVGLTP